MASVATVVLAVLSPGIAQADPLPAAYNGSTLGDVMSLDVTAMGETVSGTLAHAATATDSMADPRAHAESANLEAGAVGITTDVVSAEANANDTTPTDSYDVDLGVVEAPGLLTTGMLTGIGQTNWDGDEMCVPDGMAISQSLTQVESVTIGTSEVQILDGGAMSTSGMTTLSSGSVVTTNTSDIGAFTMADGLIGVEVATIPEITATSDGTTGMVSANDYAISVTVGGDTVTLHAGDSLPLSIAVGADADADLTISVGDLVDNSIGAVGSGSLDFINVTGRISTLVSDLATFDFTIGHLEATATAPDDGVECDALDPPVIMAPTNGKVTGDMPMIRGTGTAGDNVDVTINDDMVGSTVVMSDDTWSLALTTALADGPQTVVAAQTDPDGDVTTSDPVTFVADAGVPTAPVITSPADGSVINDNMPTIMGTGIGGDMVTVMIDGQAVCSTEVQQDGTWSLDLTTALDDGTHTATATQTSPYGEESPESDPVNFTVDTMMPTAPVITMPTQGQTVDTETTTIAGTGTAGDTIEVTLNGDVAGTTMVDEDGMWSMTSPKLACGENTVSAVEIDAAGNRSEPSEEVTFMRECAPLPVTGTPVNPAVAALSALALIGLGVVMLQARRRFR